MKTIANNPITKLAVLLTAALLMTLVKVCGAQSLRADASVMGAPTSLAAHESNAKTTSMSFERVRSITEGALREAIGTELTSVSAIEVAQKLEATYDLLKNGNT